MLNTTGSTSAPKRRMLRRQILHAQDVGNETTTNLIGNMLNLPAQRSELWAYPRRSFVGRAGN